MIDAIEGGVFLALVKLPVSAEGLTMRANTNEAESAG